MKYACVVVLIVFLCSSLTRTQALDLYTLGNGQDACSGWLEFRKNEHVHEGQVKWVLGFLTGSNYRTEVKGHQPIPGPWRPSLTSTVRTILRINSSWPRRHSCKRAAAR
jgi:hypothetical protein